MSDGWLDSENKQQIEYGMAGDVMQLHLHSIINSIQDAIASIKCYHPITLQPVWVRAI